MTFTRQMDRRSLSIFPAPISKQEDEPWDHRKPHQPRHTKSSTLTCHPAITQSIKTLLSGGTGNIPTMP